MRHITRFPKPEILEKKGAAWTTKFLESGNRRPHSSQYAHPKIREVLYQMSHHKCYYCEQKLIDKTKEIDHYIEVSERRDLAFEWDNLYLTCKHCNGKLPNTSIPVGETLNPCVHSDEEIAAELEYDDEIMVAKVGATLGVKTIQKYRLDSEFLDRLRARELIRFHKTLDRLRTNQIKENGRALTLTERNILKRFAQPDYPFSLLFRLLLKQVGLI